MRCGARFFRLVEGGDWEDEDGEFVQACMVGAALGGRWPRDFIEFDVAKECGCRVWELAKAPAYWVERARLKLAVERQIEADRAENSKG